VDKYNVYSYDQLVDKLCKLSSKGDKIVLDKLNECVYRYSSKNNTYSDIVKKVLGLNVEHSKLLDIHHELNAPVILIRNRDYVLNPVLKDLSFARKYDSFTAYQDLEMFISGVMGGNSPMMITIEDKYRIQSHGFDKYSFRKGKSKA
jgi:hypothetical protein